MSSAFTTFEATYRIVTPMFCGGADHAAELRLASFKGALRFWWRSLQWGRVKDAAELWENETKLFGSSDQKYGRSKVSLRFLGAPELAPVNRVNEIFEEGKLLGAHYLAYGVMEAFASRQKNTEAGQLTREMIPQGTFTVGLRCGPSLSPTQLREVKDALVVLGTTGGLGSKARKGFGSLTLTELKQNGELLPLSSTPGERLRATLQDTTTTLPDWTAWSKDARVIEVSGPSKAVKLLDTLGRELVYFRSWGNNGKVLGQDSEKNFKGDHDLSKGLSADINHPARVVFGLPHSYGKSSADGVTPKSLERRASPLFLHIHQVATERPVGVITFLPSLFLPKDEQLSSFGSSVDLNRDPSFWKPVHDYLDRLLGEAGATEKNYTNLRAQEVDLV